MNPPVLKSLRTSAAVATAALALSAVAAAPAVATTAPSGQAPSAPSATAYHHWYKLGKVTARHGVNIRQYPNTHSRILGSYPHHAIVKIKCKVRGEEVRGNDRWYKLAWRPGYVSARWVKNLDHIPWCGRH